MDRNEFPQAVVDAGFDRSGGRCECNGCGVSSHKSHVGRCLATFWYFERATSDSARGWQADHALGSWDNSLQNLRILCIACHKNTPSYGRNNPSRGLGDVIARAYGALSTPPPSLSSLLMSQNPVPLNRPAPPKPRAPLAPLFLASPKASEPSALVKAIMAASLAQTPPKDRR